MNKMFLFKFCNSSEFDSVSGLLKESSFSDDDGTNVILYRIILLIDLV